MRCTDVIVGRAYSVSDGRTGTAVEKTCFPGGLHGVVTMDFDGTREPVPASQLSEPDQQDEVLPEDEPTDDP